MVTGIMHSALTIFVIIYPHFIQNSHSTTLFCPWNKNGIGEKRRHIRRVKMFMLLFSIKQRKSMNRDYEALPKPFNIFSYEKDQK